MTSVCHAAAEMGGYQGPNSSVELLVVAVDAELLSCRVKEQVVTLLNPEEEVKE